MNEEQLKVAAIKYCELMGLNPDEMVDVSQGLGCVRGPRWTTISKDIKRHEAMREAIEFGKSM